MFHSRSASAIFFVVLLMSPLLFAQFDPARVLEAEYAIIQSRTIRSSANEVFNLSLNVSLPYDGRLVRSPSSSTLQTDSLGNPFLSIWEPAPDFPYTFLINSTVTIKSEPLRELPSNFVVGSDTSAYMRSSADVPSSDPSLAGLALSITANSSDDFEAIARLARYVHYLIYYDSAMAGQRPKVSQIMANPRGVCTEYSLLFVTLARASGYPARFVGGYAYSSDLGDWQGHSWAEVWLGKWVAVDPTWLEVGTLDATHIPLTRTAEPDSQTLSVSAMVSGHGELQLEQEVPGGAPIDQVLQLSMTEQPNWKPLLVSVSSQKIPPGGQAIVWMEYVSDRYGMLDTRMAPCTSKQGSILRLTGQNQSIITRPNKTYYFIWETQASLDLDPDYDYHCPLSLGVEGYDSQAVPISIGESAAADWPILSAEIENSKPLPFEPVKVFVRASRSLAGQTVHLLSTDLHLQSKLDRNGQATFEFIPTGTGSKKIYLFSSVGDPHSLTYEVQSSSSPTLNVQGPSLAVQVLEPFNVTINVRGLGDAAGSSSRLLWSFDGQSGELPITSSSERLNIVLKAESAGEPILLARLVDSTGSELARSVRSFFIYGTSNISVSSVDIFSSVDGGKETVLWFKRDGDVRDARLYIGSDSWYVGEQSQMNLVLPLGSHAAKFSWVDLAGKTHESEFTINITSTPILISPAVADSMRNGYTFDLSYAPLIIFIILMTAFSLIILKRMRFAHSQEHFSDAPEELPRNLLPPPSRLPPESKR